MIHAELLPVLNRMLTTGEDACRLIRVEANVWRLLRHLATHDLLHPAIDLDLIDEALAIGQRITDSWEADAIMAATIIDHAIHPEHHKEKEKDQ